MVFIRNGWAVNLSLASPIHPDFLFNTFFAHDVADFMGSYLKVLTADLIFYLVSNYYFYKDYHSTIIVRVVYYNQNVAENTVWFIIIFDRVT